MSRAGQSNVERLSELLSSMQPNNNAQKPYSQDAISYLKQKPNFDGETNPKLEELVGLIQAQENVNYQLNYENKYLKDELGAAKVNLIKLIDENTGIHQELKNVTVNEILNELPHLNKSSGNDENDQATLQTILRNKDQELQQSQQLINELQARLKNELTKNYTRNTTKKSLSGTMDIIDTEPLCCSKCSEELELKIRQIENLRMENEQLKKSKQFMKSKIEEFELKESDLVAQVKKYVDLVKYLEMEKNQAVAEKEQYLTDKLNTDAKFEALMNEFNEKMTKEKEMIVNNVEAQLKTLIDQNQNLEEKFFKQESLVDRLTRDKVSLTSELESYKEKCNAIDLDTYQMSEKLKNKYQEILKERDSLLYENKRVRHDYDAYVKDNDQDKFCLRNELNATRNRLMDVEKELLQAKEQCIQLTEEINKTEADLLTTKHSKETVESSRNEDVKQLQSKFEKRESQLIAGVEALQARYTVTVKDLEDLIEMQKKLLNKLRGECKVLNEQLGLLAAKYKKDVGHLTAEYDELAVRFKKYEERVREFEDQNVKHNDLHDRMKSRLKELTLKIEQQHEEIQKSKSGETLMQTTNLQLIQEVNALKQQLSLYTMPTKFSVNDKRAGMGGLQSSRSGPLTAMDSARTLTQSYLYSLK